MCNLFASRTENVEQSSKMQVNIVHLPTHTLCITTNAFVLLFDIVIINRNWTSFYLWFFTLRHTVSYVGMWMQTTNLTLNKINGNPEEKGALKCIILIHKEIHNLMFESPRVIPRTIGPTVAVKMLETYRFYVFNWQLRHFLNTGLGTSRPNILVLKSLDLPLG